ncbi:MAG: YlmH/Sll1252 family protein [Defluviitaleaceae bacterium]|nr:YlmH/Sll1252 family protein [Defluviitaleaceae bacterium]
MGQLDLLLAHMEDIAGKAIKTGCAASRFLTPAEAKSVREYFKNDRRVSLSFDGGFEDAERVRAIFANPDWGTYDQAGLFAALKIKWRSQDTLTHRDILGALMALGIERDTLGDIVCEDACSTLVCLPELGGYIAGNITKAGRVGITVAEIGLGELPAKLENLTVKTVSVASLRLDAVLCASFGLSRSRAAELISAGRVNLDHKQCLQPAKEVREGAMLSVRGLGRVKLLEVGNVSRKGRIFLQLGLYVR